jgi:hypothetical protein
MICPYCKADIHDKAVLCVHCGNPINHVNTDELSWQLCCVSCVLPIVGIIIYFTWKDSRPNQSKIAGYIALVSIIWQIIFWAWAFSQL